MKIAVRMDDITPLMDREKFDAFKALLDEYRIKPLIGVVPDNQDENLNKEKNAAVDEFFQEICALEQDGWVIALHGYRHVYTRKNSGIFPLNHFSEFAGISYEEQKNMLSKATEILAAHGITTDIFMAPAHSYDKNTLRALKELGFSRITDGFGSRPYQDRGMTFYPVSFRLSSSVKKKKGTTTMVVHTNTMTDNDLNHYREIFKTGQVISYGEYMKMPAADRTVFGRIGEYMMAAAKHFLMAVKSRLL